MEKHKHIPVFLFFGVFLFLFSTSIVYGHSATEEDSLICRQYDNYVYSFLLSDSLILPMSDTLIELSRIANMPKIETRALLYKLRHYIAVKDLDSILVYTDYLKNFTKKQKQKNFYFLTWRYLIQYYIDERYFDLAVKEIAAMPKVATEANYIQGVIESYRMLSALYQARGLHNKAIDNMEKAIAMTSEYKINDYNLFAKYVVLAESYIAIGNYDKAEETLESGLEHCSSEVMAKEIFCGLAKLYIEKGDLPQARKIIDTLITTPTFKLAEKIKNYYSLEAQYYYKIGNYNKSLEYFDLLQSKQKPDDDVYLKESLCLQKLGRYSESNERLYRAFAYKDSISKKDIEHDVYQQLVLFEVNSISAENDKLSNRLRDAQFHYIKIGLFFTIFIALIFIYLSIRYRKLNKKLIASENIRSAFLNNLSHQIRTPLNSVVGFASVIADETIPKSEQKKYIEIIKLNSDILLSLISDAVDVSNVESTGKNEQVDINLIIRKIIYNYRNKVQKNISVKFNKYEGDSIFYINGDKVTKVITTLFDNSARLTKEGSITIDVFQNDHKSISIVITDTGPGIPIEKQKEVFDYFVKLNDSSPGLGLGLSIAKIIAESMKGSLTIDKSYTDGCRFIFNFPAYR